MPSFAIRTTEKTSRETAAVNFEEKLPEGKNAGVAKRQCSLQKSKHHNELFRSVGSLSGGLLTWNVIEHHCEFIFNLATF